MDQLASFTSFSNTSTNSLNANSIITTTADMSSHRQNTTDILTNTNETSFNGSDTTVSTLFANVTNTTLAGNITYYEPFVEPFEYKFVFGYISLALVIIGIVGNALSIAVLTRPKHQNSSTATYLTGLAVSDIIILLSGPLTGFLLHVCDFNYRTRGVFWCKISLWITYSSVTTSSWILIAVTIERTISVTFPYHVKRACTPKISKIVVAAIWCTMYTLHSHLLFGMGYAINRYDLILCGPLTTQYANFIYDFFPWIDFTMVFAIPYFFIFFGNIIIIVQLTRSLMKRQKLTTAKKNTGTSLTVTLVVVNITFMLTISPLTIFLSILPYFDLSDPARYFTFAFVNELLNVLSNINAAVNFFLYFMSGAKFRADVKELFGICIKGIERKRSSTSGGTSITRDTLPTIDTVVANTSEKK